MQKRKLKAFYRNIASKLLRSEKRESRQSGLNQTHSENGETRQITLIPVRALGLAQFSDVPRDQRQRFFNFPGIASAKVLIPVNNQLTNK